LKQLNKYKGHSAALVGIVAAAAVVVALSCSSVDVVRLQPDLIEVPEGMEPVAGIQATCIGFYIFTLGLPDADLEKAVNELLMTEARKLGAERVMNLRFEATPESGIWWLTKLLGFRSASASGVAIKREPGGEANDAAAPPPPLMLPTPEEKEKKAAPASQPAL
jgi:hypothetical protein